MNCVNHSKFDGQVLTVLALCRKFKAGSQNL